MLIPEAEWLTGEGSEALELGLRLPMVEEEGIKEDEDGGQRLSEGGVWTEEEGREEVLRETHGMIEVDHHEVQEEAEETTTPFNKGISFIETTCAVPWWTHMHHFLSVWTGPK